MNARFILAKYAPDVARMEPRNVGVILWYKGEFASKFLATADAAFVHDANTYRRWVAFWRDRMSGETVRPNRGKPVPKSDAASFDALITNQKGNYLLVDAGDVLSRMTPRKMDAAVAKLFAELVATKETSSPKSGRHFARQCDDVFQSANVQFKPHYAVEARWRGEVTTVHPDYYIGNGKPDAIAQRARLSSEVSVHHAALTVDAIQQSGLTVNRCRVLYRGSDLEGDGHAEQGLRLLKQLCPAIDVESPTAIEEVAELAALNVRR
ncbi:MAG: hypothetical protein KF774_16430 [Planctomyces sp.]|nr:hypothetical protein [Planctomyces sp.]